MSNHQFKLLLIGAGSFLGANLLIYGLWALWILRCFYSWVLFPVCK
jgi:hypothetical protein